MLSDAELTACHAVGLDPLDCRSVCRFRWKYQTYSSVQYSRQGKSDSTVVRYSVEAVDGRNFGRITAAFVKEEQVFCVLAVIKLTGESITSVCPKPRDEVLDQMLALCDYGKHFSVCAESEEYVCIKAEQIVGHSLLLPFGAGNRTYITEMPLHFEHS